MSAKYYFHNLNEFHSSVLRITMNKHSYAQKEVKKKLKS